MKKLDRDIEIDIAIQSLARKIVDGLHEGVVYGYAIDAVVDRIRANYIETGKVEFR